MPSYLLLIPIFLPILGGSLLLLPRFKSAKVMRRTVAGTVLLTSLFVLLLLVFPPNHSFTPLHFANNLHIGFKMDGLAKVFAALVALLWPLATLYAFNYMKDAPRQATFFGFYTITFGVTLGIAFAQNLVTLYVFYELLTFVTMPLVMHGMSHEAVRASRKYLYFSLGGSAFAFIGMIFLIRYGATTEFVSGGLMGSLAGRADSNLLLIAYLMTFCGFGVKAALFPMHSWLPSAAVAPTPVTALLHAVAVVKSGVFAIMRITFCCFGVSLLHGTWVQNVVMIMSAFSIVYGSSLSLKEPHLKRRLAYSTVGNLSYILFGVTLMTPEGLTGGLLHMIAHAVTKIAAFYCAGTLTQLTGRQYVHELDGLGRRMPVLYTCFAVSALSLTGIPPFTGFISKWSLASAAVSSGTALSWVGVGALLLSALLTALYMFPVIVPAFFPRKESLPIPADVKDPGASVLVPLIIFTVAMLVFGVAAEPLIAVLSRVANAMV